MGWRDLCARHCRQTVLDQARGLKEAHRRKVERIGQRKEKMLCRGTVIVRVGRGRAAAAADG